MFSFHKPKIYRSLQGCCICRAKSSSSRFTDSKRYEYDFEKCFDIVEPRTGEICNACVLLVKRWKKLPVGSTRNWHHVVDARAGPGTKSMNKIKNKAAGIIKQDPLKDERFKKKHKHKHHKKHHVMKLQMQKAASFSALLGDARDKSQSPSTFSDSGILKTPQSPSTFSDDIGDECLSEDRFSNYGDGDYTPYSHSEASDDEDEDAGSNTRSSSSRTGSLRRKSPNPLHFSSFLDLNYWKKTEICCGIIFKGSNGEVLLDPSLMRPCRSCNKSNNSRRTNTATTDNHSPRQAPETKSLASGASSMAMMPNNSGAAMVMDTNPPTPFEVEPMNDQAPALSPVPAKTPSMMEDDDNEDCESDDCTSYNDQPILDLSSRSAFTSVHHQQTSTSTRFMCLEV